MTKGMRVGYIRVSTLDQKIERQLENIQLDKVFIDKCSGKDLNRPQFQIMMNFVREGDRVIVDSMDRMARNLDDLRKIVKDLTSKSIEIEFIKENLIFNGEDSPLSHLLLSMMGAFAEFERSLIRERQREGIMIARAKGVYKNRGRDRCLKSDEIIQLKKWVEEGMAKTWIAKQLEISRASVYKYLKDNPDQTWIEENKKAILLESIKGK
jgi:DNA invertase Pin-like site-specific DNA recombinase